MAEDRELQQVTESLFLGMIKGAKVEALEVRDTKMNVFLSNGWLIGCRLEDGRIKPVCADAIYLQKKEREEEP